jgi:endonuclease/exonuclease/phosphatase family metal-dependent hydrolase
MIPSVSELQTVSASERDHIANAPRNSETHRKILADLPGLNTVETGGAGAMAQLPPDFIALAWNLERCLFPEDSAAHICAIAPQVLMLSEMDHGMARTKQRHTTRCIATALGMVYVFGVEFFEMSLGGETERSFCEDDFNARGWHGNAILSAVPFDKVSMFRLDDHGHWFSGGAGDDVNQPRIGGRNAIAAIIPGATGPICFVSTHLESNADSAHRAAQFDHLMDNVDAFAPDMPVLIGGDLNTGNHLPPDFDWRGDALFQRAEARGYDWSFSADGMTTRPSLITPHPTRQMKLDWFGARGLTCSRNGILPSLDVRGRPLSDHDAIFAVAAM